MLLVTVVSAVTGHSIQWQCMLRDHGTDWRMHCS